MNIFEVMGNTVQQKFDNIKEIFLNCGYTNLESIMLSNFITDYDIKTINKESIIKYKKDISKLIYIVVNLENCIMYYNECGGVERSLIYMYNNKHINFLIDSILKSSHKDKIFLIKYREYYNKYKDMLILRL